LLKFINKPNAPMIVWFVKNQHKSTFFSKYHMMMIFTVKRLKLIKN